MSTIEAVERYDENVTGHDRAALPCVLASFPSCSRNSIVEENHKYRCILLFGMPGSGKGTQGAVLGQLPSLVHISMGDIFRKIPRTGKFGREIEKYTSQGLMVPDDLTVRIFERHLMILEMQELVVARAAYPDSRRAAPQLCPGGAARLAFSTWSRSST